MRGRHSESGRQQYPKNFTTNTSSVPHQTQPNIDVGTSERNAYENRSFHFKVDVDLNRSLDLTNALVVYLTNALVFFT